MKPIFDNGDDENMKYLVTYDARPIAKLTQYVCKARKYLQSGMKFECIEEDQAKVEEFKKHYGDVIFKRDGSARGWNTLYWTPYVEPKEGLHVQQHQLQEHSR